MLHGEQGAKQSPNKSKVCTLLAAPPVLTVRILNTFFSFQYLISPAGHTSVTGTVKVTVTTDWQLGLAARTG